MAKEELPKLPAGWVHMTAPYEFRLDGEGHCLQFSPDAVVAVPRGLQPDALARGATPVEGTAQAMRDNAPEKPLDPSSEDYRVLVRMAAETILSVNDTSDFGGNGQPSVKAWERELGFKPVKAVAAEIWATVRSENFGA